MAAREGVALRVSQLDAAELDSEILSITKAQLAKLFKYHQTNVVATFEPEINAGLKLLIWKFSVKATESTLGQKLLNLRYLNNYAGSSTNQWISRRQKILYACLLIGCPWLKERSHDILKLFGLQRWRENAALATRWMELCFKISTVVNFLIFLQKGRYLSVLERIIGIQSVFPEQQASRQVTFEFMTRELLWHGFSEFLFFMLPLVNFQRLRNFVIRRMLPATPQSGQSSNSARDYTSCSICREWPIRAQEIGCSHVFCYFCIYSHMKADPSFCCPDCGLGVDDLSYVSPVKVVTEDKDDR